MELLIVPSSVTGIEEIVVGDHVVLRRNIEEHLWSVFVLDEYLPTVKVYIGEGFAYCEVQFGKYQFGIEKDLLDSALHLLHCGMWYASGHDCFDSKLFPPKYNGVIPTD